MARRPIPVFVGNISFETSETMVWDLFSSVGPVMAVRFVQDKETGKTKGYGFVEFGDPALAEAAVRVLNGRELGGRALRVDFAEHPDGTRVVVGQRRGECFPSSRRAARVSLALLRPLLTQLLCLCTTTAPNQTHVQAPQPRPHLRGREALRCAALISSFHPQRA
jgi:RNA recognition motif-containing protein